MHDQAERALADVKNKLRHNLPRSSLGNYTLGE